MPYSLFPQFARQRQAARQLRHDGMKRGIKTRNLRQVRIVFADGLDDLNLRRQVQGRQRNQLPEIFHQRRSDFLRRRMLRAAVDNAVSGGLRARQPRMIYGGKNRRNALMRVAKTFLFIDERLVAAAQPQSRFRTDILDCS